jgi:RNA polymerase sigma factor (TIGR02999 family)
MRRPSLYDREVSSGTRLAIIVQSGDFTTLLQQCTGGNREALDALTPIVYAELRKLAARFMRNERPGGTLQPTALIHEAYLQLVQHELPGFQSRAHFFGIAARIMRQLLIGNARRYRAQKRGGGNRVEMQDDIPIPAQQAEELLAVDQALDRLASQDERKARVIEMKHFGGLSREEIAQALGISVASVKHDLALGEAWLRRALSTKPAGRAAWPT